MKIRQVGTESCHVDG